jgi:hypothetical protein
MVITYRRTGGLFMLLVVAAAALAATVFTVAVVGTFLIVSAAIATMAVLGRAMLPRRWRRRPVPPVRRWAHRVPARGDGDITAR